MDKQFYVVQVNAHGFRAGEVYQVELLESGALMCTAYYGAGAVEISPEAFAKLTHERDALSVTPIRNKANGMIYFYALAYGLAVWIRGEDYEAVRPSRALDEYSPAIL